MASVENVWCEGKLLSGKVCMLVVQLVSVKGSESEWFRIDSWVRQGCIISPWLFNVYMDRVMRGVGMRRRV